MPIEYTALALMTVFFLLAWVPLSIGKIRSFGKKWILSNRKPVAGKELLPWAARCERAYHCGGSILLQELLKCPLPWNLFYHRSYLQSLFTD